MSEREHRLFVSRPLTVFHNGQERTIQVSNLSSTGACLIGLRSLAVGAPVTIHHKSLRIQARVVWSKDESTGVRFESPLEFGDLLDLQFG